MEPIKYRFSKKSRFVYLASVLLCVGLAVAIVHPVFVPDQRVLWVTTPVAFLLVLAAVYAAICGQRPFLIISDAGLKVGVGIAPIPWDQIEQVSMGSYFWSKILMIKFVDPKQFMAQRPIFRFFRFCFAPKNGYDFATSIGGLEPGHNEIVTTIESILSLERDR
jgi:hypothetical protein